MDVIKQLEKLKIDGLSPKRLKKLMRIRKRHRLRNKLNKLWERLSENPTKEGLRYLINHIDSKTLKNRACEELLKNGELSPDDLALIFEEIDDKSLKEKAWQRFLEVGASSDTLRCVIRFVEPLRKRAFQELLIKINDGSIKKWYAIQILQHIIIYVEPLRPEAWEKFKRLNPSHRDLVEVREALQGSGSQIPEEIHNLFKKKFKQERHNVEIIQKMHVVLDETKKLKKGQE